jgi:hypothetical protein
MTNPEILILYRQILKRAKIFPSKNRYRIFNEIRAEFRRNRSIEDPKKLETAISLAKKGLGQLSMYTDLPSTQKDWQVNLEEEPMPKPKSR